MRNVSFFLFLLVLTFSVFNLLSIENFGLINSLIINAGQCNDLINDENNIYVASDYGFFIFNAENTDKLEIIGSYKTKEPALTIEKVSNFVIICTNEKALFIDVSIPSNLVVLSEYNFAPPYSPLKICINEDLVYISIKYDGLSILDISDIYNPTRIAYFEDKEPECIYFADNYIYMLEDIDDSIQLEIYSSELTDELNLLGSTTFAGSYPYEIQTIDNYAMIAAGDANLQVIDVSNPANPIFSNEYHLHGTSSTDLFIRNNIIFMSGVGDLGLTILDITIPNSPIFINTFEYNGVDLCVTENRVFLCREEEDPFIHEGIGVINVEDYNNLFLENEFRTSRAMSLDIENNKAFIANGYSGLKILNIADPSQPIHTTDFSIQFRADEIYAESDMVYLNAYTEEYIHELFLIDVSNVYEPVITDQISTNSISTTIAKSGDFLYLAGLRNSVEVYNVADPYDIHFAFDIQVNDWAYDLVIKNEVLFVAGYWGGLQVFDISNPDNIHEISSYAMEMCQNITVNDDLVFTSPGGYIFDISSPSDIQLCDSSCYSSGNDMIINNNSLFVGSDYGLKTYDISNPYNIGEATIINEFESLSLDCDGSYLYSIDYFELKIYGDTLLTSTHDDEIIKPQTNLYSYPNPFVDSNNKRTEKITIAFNLTEKSKVSLTSYNLKGQKIKNHVNKTFYKGNHTILWDLTDNNGEKLPSGVYFNELIINEKSHSTNKCLIIK